jgi:hypothetical protein
VEVAGASSAPESLVAEAAPHMKRRWSECMAVVGDFKAAGSVQQGENRRYVCVLTPPHGIHRIRAAPADKRGSRAISKGADLLRLEGFWKDLPTTL